IELKDNTSASVNASMHFGSIHADVPTGVEQSCVLDLWIGNCAVDTSENLSRYKLNFSCTFGSVAKNGEGAGKSLQQDSETKSRITASTLLGSIRADDHGAVYVEPETTEEETATADAAAPAETDQPAA
ncbi:MAG: hypothetical protein II776_04300, partial [Clostridia bacterium]|nr:hypothetical protein [Clostridia bacterium]